MFLKLEPEADRIFNHLATNWPGFSRVITEIPAKWWEYALWRGWQYDSLVKQSAPFMEHISEIWRDKTFSHDWFSDKAWIWYELLKEFKDKEMDVLELGVFEGRSVIFVLELIEKSRVTAIDHFVLKKGWKSTQNITLQMDTEEAFRANTRVYGDRVQTLATPSWSGLTELITEKRKFDFCYIDASHTASDVLADSILAWKTLKRGGLFMWDDFLLDAWNWEKGPVGPGVLAFMRSFPNSFDMVHAGWQVAVRKKAELTQ